MVRGNQGASRRTAGSQPARGLASFGGTGVSACPTCDQRSRASGQTETPVPPDAASAWPCRIAPHEWGEAWPVRHGKRLKFGIQVCDQHPQSDDVLARFDELIEQVRLAGTSASIRSWPLSTISHSRTRCFSPFHCWRAWLLKPATCGWPHASCCCRFCNPVDIAEAACHPRHHHPRSVGYRRWTGLSRRGV